MKVRVRVMIQIRRGERMSWEITTRVHDYRTLRNIPSQNYKGKKRVVSEELPFWFSCSQHRGIIPSQGPILTRSDLLFLSASTTNPTSYPPASTLSLSRSLSLLGPTGKPQSRVDLIKNRERSSVGEKIDKTPIMRLDPN